MTNAAVPASPRMTVDEFMEWDGGGHVGKLELVNGVVRAMAPAAEAHGIIQTNIGYLLKQHLDKRGGHCRAVTEGGVVPRLNPRHNARVPGLVVTCAPRDVKRKTVTDPVLLVEILSPSNESETWESIRACATIPSVREILVVDSTRIHVEVFRTDERGVWAEESETVEAGGTLRLASIEAEFAIEEVYAGTHLASA